MDTKSVIPFGEIVHTSVVGLHMNHKLNLNFCFVLGLASIMWAIRLYSSVSEFDKKQQ